MLAKYSFLNSLLRRESLLAALVLFGIALLPLPGRGQQGIYQRPESTSSQSMSSESNSGQAENSNAAQQNDYSKSFSKGFARGSTVDTSGIPAEQIVATLREHPSLLGEIKKALVKKLQEAGRPVMESEITDEALFKRIRTDSQVRSFLAQKLIDLGYLNNPQEQANQIPTLRHRPPGYRPPSETATTNENEAATAPPGNPALPPPTPEPNQPQVQELENPYNSLPTMSNDDLPALKDLYTQIPSQGAEPKRFGADVFKSAANVTGEGTPSTQDVTYVDNLPIDLPVGPDYVLGPGDTLSVEMWGSTSQQLRLVVSPTGQVALPEAGTVLVAGKTLSEASQLIQAALSHQFKDVKIDVSLSRLRTVRVYVVGDVQNPGPYDISSLSTPLNALIVAGGPTPNGSMRDIRHYRGKELVSDVDLYDFLLKGVRSGVEHLEPGDTILVPPVGPQVTVRGMVRRPAIYDLKKENTLGEALDLAGGVLVSGDLHKINIERIEAHQNRIMISLAVPDASDGEVVSRTLSDFRMQDGDRVLISPILPYSNKTVYLEGHVFRPGKYTYNKGMTLVDLIRSYKDLLPEPAERAEIIRLQQPDLRPKVMEFQLADVLSGDDPIELEPFDTVRVFGRYEYDAPTVSIHGEVLRPGDYPMANGMTAAALLRLAGGFRRSAYTESADLASYSIADGKKVLTERQSVEIGKVAAGDSEKDVVLKAGDILTIRQLGGWNDIGASITLSGEVMYPGTYGIQIGEKLSSVIKRAGGFRDTAYPAGAVLERDQIRELDNKARQQLLDRIESATPTQIGTNTQEQAAAAQSFLAQQKEIVDHLKQESATGRLVIHITKDVSRWQNTMNDIELRAGDVLLIPKTPSFVLVTGQANSATAITYSPGKNAGWYLARAGGVTQYADKKQTFVVRADGSVIGRGGSSEWWKGNVFSTILNPGDTVVVPEKINNPNPAWKSVLETAQVTSALAIAARVATSF